ncbi:OmpA family protein [Halorhodospira halochloris]|uniref:Flagellar motor rotation protein MotB n=1 Tax=Halorhodospira halochloris TaxID=1052 RepID=A0A0X8XCQ8_HALHR|nr:OmpA family protein [Halorhodospira halochloris]MBK1652148.1 hypothetical protein [Halorhodospira halochloris]MCG5530576.1 OmpA family protein [Halorhodospira halochloris]MCG5547842.1 OmpA family protein [Halorhodospira halochloris]BAU58434.1 flagellar motor rotation protein MotB [Halorhodospira halochloris]
MSEGENTPVRRRGGFARNIQAEGEKEEDTSWLLVYLDVITLLLIVFVILLVLLDPDPDDEPRGHGVFDGTEHVFEGRPTIIEGRPDSPDAVEIPIELQERGIEAAGEEDTLTFRLDDAVLFETAGAELLPEGQDAIDELVPIFEATGARISIEGHTDNIPISTAQFPSNWELSSARASSVLRYLADQGIAQNRMRAIGYGDIRPIASNETAEGRAQNRRVEITLHFDPTRDDFDELPLD